MSIETPMGEAGGKARRTPAQKLLDTKIFDAKYYAAQVGRNFKSDLQAAEDFVSGGMLEGYSLHPLFDVGYFPDDIRRQYQSGDVEAILKYLRSPASREHAWSMLLDPRMDVFRSDSSRILSQFRAGVERKVPAADRPQPHDWTQLRKAMITHARRKVALLRHEEEALRHAMESAKELPGDPFGTSNLKAAAERSELSPDYVGAIDYWARQLTDAKQRNWFIGQSNKTRSLGARDVLAHSATKGRYRYHDLSLVLETLRIDLYEKDALRGLKKTLWKPGFRGLARVLYCQRSTAYDLLNSLTIYETLISVFGSAALEDVDRSYYQDLLIEQGNFDAAGKVLKNAQAKNEQRRINQSWLHLNSLNPATTGDPGLETAWLEGINALYRERGFAPIGLTPGDGPAFFRLESAADPVDGEMPLVSIIMPIYEPDESTDVAIESLLKQSWTNIELIIVDDGSPQRFADGRPTDYQQRLERWRDADSRIKLILNKENRGAYWARNTGYDVAAGEFVTVADKDDWHHPQKIEQQATELLREKERVANMTNWVRVDEDLRFLLRWGPDRVVHPSFASIMYRREEIKSTLGYWDNVRKSGDGEFKFRLQAAYGIDLQPEEPTPLAISLIGEGNLTSTDLGLGFEHPDRNWYKRAFDAWHREIRAGRKSPYLAKEPEHRPFVAPNNFLPEKPSYEPLDVAYLSEFGFEAGNTTVLQNEIRTSVRAGLSVGIIPSSNFLISSAAKREIGETIESMVLDGSVQRISVTSKVSTKLLVIRWPAVLEFTRDTQSSIEADNVIVISNHMPYEKTDNRRSYDIMRVSETVRRMFGVEPEWVPESERVWEVLRPLVPKTQLSSIPWKGILADEWHGAATRVPSFECIPVIGRHARDHVTKWPGKRGDLLNVYPVDGSVAVSILGGAVVPLERGLLTAEEIGAWEILPFNSVPAREYLQGLDFFVYYPHEDLKEAYGMAIVEAMATGVVVVLPEDFRPVFGEAAVYADVPDVQDTVKRLWDDPERYLHQQEAGKRFVSQTASPAAYLKTLGRYGVRTLEGGATHG